MGSDKYFVICIAIAINTVYTNKFKSLDLKYKK